MLATDRRGGYMSTTIVCCNTRKYHGMIVAPIDDSQRDYVLLSSLDETVVLNGQPFNLAIHRFEGGAYEPRGHKYITDFEYTPTPTLTYMVGDMVLKKELLWIHKRTQLMVRYTLVSSSEQEVTLRLRPFLAYRDVHALCKANLEANGYSHPIDGGVKCRLYDGFPWLHMQMSDDISEFVPAPDWYNNFEYERELERGYEGHEDLITPGYFETMLRVGESVIFSASTEMMPSSQQLIDDFDLSISRRTHKIDFLSCLHHSARQFVVRRNDGGTEIVAGYPWYGVIGRDAFLSLPGLTIEQGYEKDCMDALDTIISYDNQGKLNDTFRVDNAVDTPLWFFRVLQRLEKSIGAEEIWSKYGATMKRLLSLYQGDQREGVELHDNGLIWSWSDYKSLTWMDTTIENEHARRRNGYLVEVNALWYNAVCYTVDMATKFDDKELVEQWGWVVERAKETFNSLFWSTEDGMLADFVNNEIRDRSIRPNMIVACALDYKLIDMQKQIAIIRTVQQHLLTPMGLRSLSPMSHDYGSSSITMRSNKAMKNGSVWVWPLMFYAKACFDVLGDKFLPDAEKLLDGLKDANQSYGIGSIGEYFDSDPPYHARGAVSQASSVAAALEIIGMIDFYSAALPKKKAAPKRKPAAKKPAAKKATTTDKPAPKKRVKKAEVKE
ncbi:MAG: glycogen debranching enzyme N-terminal domain-containing protein [Rikenellaceae bacterium]